MPRAFTYNRLIKLAWKQYLLRFDVILLSFFCFCFPINLAFDVFIKPPTLQQLTINDVLILIEQLTNNYTYVILQSLSFFITIFLSVIIILTVQHSYYNKITKFNVLLKLALKYFFIALALDVLITFFTIIGCALLIIPGLIVWTLLSLSLPAAVWHNLKLGAALRYSWKIVKPYWLLVFNYLFITKIFVTLLGIMIASLLPALPGFTALSLTINSLINSFYIVVATLLLVILDKRIVIKQK